MRHSAESRRLTDTVLRRHVQGDLLLDIQLDPQHLGPAMSGDTETAVTGRAPSVVSRSDTSSEAGPSSSRSIASVRTASSRASSRKGKERAFDTTGAQDHNDEEDARSPVTAASDSSPRSVRKVLPKKAPQEGSGASDDEELSDEEDDEEEEEEPSVEPFGYEVRRVADTDLGRSSTVD